MRNTAEHAGSSSGLVVAMGMVPPPTSLKTRSWNTESSSRSSVSAWATAVLHSGHQSVGVFFL